jgi:hypothetical protein
MSNRQRYALLAMQSGFGFIKSSLLGTSLFATFDYFYYPSVSQSGTPGGGEVAFICGSISGVVHGSLVSASDIIQSKMSTFRSVQSSSILSELVKSGIGIRGSTGGIILSHALVHGTLFGVYETTRISATETILKHVESSRPRHQQREEDQWITVAAETVSVALAGTLAGLASECVGHYLEPLENIPVPSSSMRNSSRVKLWREAFGKVGSLPPPSLRVLCTAAVPSAIGFLAYEYGKFETVD